MINDNVKTIYGCAVWFIVAILLFKGCDWFSSYQKEKKREAYIEKKQNDSIRKVYIKDSLAHDPRYQDSLRREKKEYEKWKKEEDEISKKEIVGFALFDDSIYHTSFHFVQRTNRHFHNFLAKDRTRLVFLTSEEVENKSYKLCQECKETETVKIRYEDGELFDIESARDYDLIPIEEANDYCNHHNYDYR